MLRLRLNLLVSYPFIRKSESMLRFVTEIAPYCNVLIDCGAFSNFSNRRKRAVGMKLSYDDVTFEDYSAACKKYFHGVVWQYIMLDVVRNYKESMRNLNAMLDSGLLPMPVLLEGIESTDIEKLVKINPRLCVAGGVQSSDVYIRKRYKDAYEASGKLAKIHALGFGRFPDVYKLPIATSDSSAFMAGFKFGNLLRFNPVLGFQGMHWKDLSAKSSKQAALRTSFLRWLLEDCKVKPSDLSQVTTYKRIIGLPSVTYTYGYLNFAQQCAERKFDYFLAISTTYWISLIFALVEQSSLSAFDYNPLKPRILELCDMSKDKPAAWVDECVRIAKERTDWTLQPHSL